MALNPITVYPVAATYLAQQLNTYTDMADVLNYLIGLNLGYTGNMQVDAAGNWQLWFQGANQNSAWTANLTQWVIVKNGSLASAYTGPTATANYTTTPPVTISQTAPVATAGAAGKASFTFADPTGPNAPYTAAISAQYTTNGTTWLPATLDSTGVTSSGGTTTVHVTGLPTGAKQFRAAVTTAGSVVFGPASNTITTT